MKDGYYLSTYIHINPLANLMDECLSGVFVRHDQNISLWKKISSKIELIHYWELERITGRKHQGSAFFAKENAVDQINVLLDTYDLSLKDMIEVWGTPELDTSDDYHSLTDYPYLPYHSIAHLFSGILLDTDIFHTSTIIGMAVDGGPDPVVDITLKDKLNWYAGCVVHKGKIQIFPVESPGKLWSYAARRFRMEEGSLMALASANPAKLDFTVNTDVVCTNSDSYDVAKEYVDNIISKVTRALDQSGYSVIDKDQMFSRSENIISATMKEIQHTSIRIMERNIERIISEYDINPREAYLSLSGGYALNCPSNSHIMNKFDFKGFMASPLMNDGGQSLGIALYAFHKKMSALGQKLDFQFHSPYLGDVDHDIFHIINNTEYSQFIEDVSELNFKQVIEDLQQSVIVWFNGPAEIGPRALGNRSILGDARSEKTKHLLNEIKMRQWWRPVAPIIIEQDLSEWFEHAFASPYMLHTFKLSQEKLQLVPAIVHLDGSARIQTVNRTQNSVLFRLIEAFKETTGIPMLCNTSLNDKGEPIINKITEAINFCLRKKIDVAYFNTMRVKFNNHEIYTEDKPLSRSDEHYRSHKGNPAIELLDEYNPHGLNNPELQWYIMRPDIQLKYNITIDRHVRILKKLYQLYKVHHDIKEEELWKFSFL
jgi:carbamoyltransferase